MKNLYTHLDEPQRDSVGGEFSHALTAVSTEELSRLPLFLRELLDSCPVVGTGVHGWIFRIARHLLTHFDERSTFELIKAKAAGCGRPLFKLEHEIVSQIRNALPYRWQPRDQCAFARAAHLPVERLSAEGHWSEHTKQQTARRVYLVVEFDFAEFGRDGKTPSRWASLVREWRIQDKSIADACAALHLHLAERLPLVCVTYSGGKSFHGWYYTLHQSETEPRHLMDYAVQLGDDSATSTPSPIMRLPEGLHARGTQPFC